MSQSILQLDNMISLINYNHHPAIIYMYTIIQFYMTNESVNYSLWNLNERKLDISLLYITRRAIPLFNANFVCKAKPLFKANFVSRKAKLSQSLNVHYIIVRIIIDEVLMMFHPSMGTKKKIYIVFKTTQITSIHFEDWDTFISEQLH